VQRIKDSEVAGDILKSESFSAEFGLGGFKPRDRSGFTLVEVLVSIGIIGLLLAITVPAVQSARSTSRRMHCMNSERQLLLAISNYHDSYSVFPPMGSWPTTGCPPESVVTRLFPFLGLVNICEMASSGATRIPILECPSDTDISLVQSPLSYSFNASAGTGSGSKSGGPFSGFTGVGARDIVDGLSMTACLSENMIVRAGGSEAEASNNQTRYGWLVVVPPISALALADPASEWSLAERAAQTDLSIQDCMEGPRSFHPMPAAALGQWIGQFGGGPWTYSHWYPPNSPTCSVQGSGNDLNVFLLNNRRAASGHIGGVSVGFLDGHVQFYSNNVDRSAWRAAGTRDGNELIGDTP
jgi:prepilin-type N-terminal cleavage/methylation domain-containing protein/prepilin-type processing-associated H-X9-DG protein